MRLAFFLAIVLLFSAAGPALGETDPEKELARIEKELSEQKTEAASLDKKEKATQQEVGKLQEQLIAATEAIQKKQDAQDRLEDQLQKLEKETENRAKTLASAEKRLADLTAALLRLSRQPPEIFLLLNAMTSDHIHRVILLRSVLPRLRSETHKITNDINRLNGLRQAFAGQKRLVGAARQNLEARQHDLDQLVQARQDLLQETVAEKAAVAEQMAALSVEAKDLRQLLEKVSHHEVLPKSAPPAPHPDLKLPVAGRIIRDYGGRDAYGVASHGLTLAAAPGSPVVAPFKGSVVFTGPFKGYGQIVIIQHSGKNHSLLAGFGRIDVDRGQKVEAGEPLGILPGKSKERPEFYFEWRHDGEPADPVVKSVSQRTQSR